MHSLYPTIILSLLATTCSSWTYPTTLDLGWPPLINEGYVTQNSVIVGDDPIFPCANAAIPANQTRALFPLTGGRVQVNLANSTTNELQDFEYNVSIYIGQLSNDESQTAFENVDVQVWRDFSTGSDCTIDIDVAYAISGALNRPVSDDEVVGLNATFGLRIVLFPSSDDYQWPAGDDRVFNVEEMWQCGYVTFSDIALFDSRYGGVCNSVSAFSATPTPSANPTVPTAVSPTAAATSPPSASTTAAALGQNTHSSKARTIGIAIGIFGSLVASLLLLFVVDALLHRRKMSRTIGAHVMVSRRQSGEDGKGGVKKNEEGESSGASVHSEQLPTYTEATKKPGRE